MAAIVEIRIPDIGNFHDVEIVEIHIGPGDTVKKEQGLITLETDKAAMEIPSPHKGTIVEVAVQLGDKVNQGDLLATMEAEPETKPAATAESKSAATENTESIPPTTAASARSEEPTIRPAPAPHQPATSGLIPAGPAVRRFARELGVDLAEVRGSGRNGRIVRGDVEAFIKNAMLARPNVADTLIPVPEVDYSAFGPVSTRELTKVQRLTGSYTHASWSRIPHVTHFDESDITETELFRRQVRAENPDAAGLTLLPLVVRAAVAALQQFPAVNSSLTADGDNLVLKQYWHIGIAVETERGLVVPVVRNANQKGLVALTNEIKDLAERARTNRLAAEEMAGGTFSISSLGHIGGYAFTPIIREPEVAILGLSRAGIQPRYQEGVLAPRTILPFSLSYDHRVIDGALAARFCHHIAESLQDARNMLL